jgi:FMN phosphatase YigB (HAD superfamily)
MENQIKTDYKIYCDLDGVLADFDRGYQELTGINTQQANLNGTESFWEPINKAGAPFWIKLKWMVDGKKLWEYIKKHNPTLLSAPSREESSRMGKRIWVKQKLPETKLILEYAEKKQNHASYNSILIDDRKKNIEQWIAAGGIGIFHTSTEETIKQLKKLGL